MPVRWGGHGAALLMVQTLPSAHAARAQLSKVETVGRQTVKQTRERGESTEESGAADGPTQVSEPATATSSTSTPAVREVRRGPS